MVEQHFEFIKQPKVTGPIYLKNPRRVHALGYVFLMALLVYAVMQRRARNNVEKEVYPMIVARNVKTDRPTGRRMIQQFFNMVTYRTDDGQRHFRPTQSRTVHSGYCGWTPRSTSPHTSLRDLMAGAFQARQKRRSFRRHVLNMGSESVDTMTGLAGSPFPFPGYQVLGNNTPSMSAVDGRC